MTTAKFRPSNLESCQGGSMAV